MWEMQAGEPTTAVGLTEILQLVNVDSSFMFLKMFPM